MAAMLLVPQTAVAATWKGALCFCLAVIFPLFLLVILLCFTSTGCSSVFFHVFHIFASARSFQVSATSPAGGHDLFFHSNVFFFAFSLSGCPLCFCVALFSFVSLFHTRVPGSLCMSYQSYPVRMMTLH